VETSKTERAAYGFFFVGQNIIYLLMLQFLNLFYTDVVGISATAVGVLFLVARTWDAINDPMLGVIIDRTNFKGGKFLPWIKAVNILLPLATIVIFINPDLSDSASLLYAYVTYIVWGMIYTLCDVPIFALSTAMAKSSEERVLILTWGRVAAIIAGLVVAAVGMPMIEALGWTRAALMLCVVAMIAMTPLRFYAIERYRRRSQKPPTLAENISYIGKHRPLKIFYLALFFAMAFNTTLVVGNYFAIYNLGNGASDWVMPLMLSAFLPMLLVAPLIPFLIRRFGKKKIFIGGMLVGATVSVLQFVIGYADIYTVLLLSGLRSGALILPLLLMGMFSADFVEYGHSKLGQRVEGLAFSVQTFMTKFTQAVAAGAGGILLGSMGYQANVEQTAETLEGIFILFTLVPATGAVIAAFIIWRFYRLPEADVQRMIDDKVDDDDVDLIRSV
jgi:GPH family glycoside/pentoside/hexuronide:cation symporter